MFPPLSEYQERKSDTSLWFSLMQDVVPDSRINDMKSKSGRFMDMHNT